MEKQYCEIHSFLDGEENCPDCNPSRVELPVKVNFAERIIEEEIEKLEKLANEYNEDMDTEGYINNLNDSNILHRVLIRIKSESKISA